VLRPALPCSSRPFAVRVTVLASVIVLSACASPDTPGSAPSTGSSTSRATTARPDTSSRPAGSASSPAAVTTSTGNAAPAPGAKAPAGYAWQASPSSTSVQVATVDGGRASLLWMDPTRLRFRFVPGFQVPEGSPATTADKNPSTWVPRMVAAFNSGYKLSDHVGGYYYLGRTVAPLSTGLASMVLRTDGSLAIGVWGRDIAMTPDTLMVRQNLPPLVLGGVSQASPTDPLRKWGIPTRNQPLQNRSALGRLADGSFVFVYAHSVIASDLAQILVKAGVQEAIALDMNVSWPTGFVYTHTGGGVVGAKINHWTVRPPSTYLTRYKKDFIAVEGV